MDKRPGKAVVNRQLIVFFKAGKMHIAGQSEIRNQTTQISLERPITEKDQIPESIVRCPLSIVSIARKLSIARKGPDEAWEILLLDESGRTKKVIRRQPILFSKFVRLSQIRISTARRAK